MFEIVALGDTNSNGPYLNFGGVWRQNFSPLLLTQPATGATLPQQGGKRLGQLPPKLITSRSGNLAAPGLQGHLARRRIWSCNLLGAFPTPTPPETDHLRTTPVTDPA